MSCKHCHDLSEARQVRIDDGLDYLLALVRGELSDGTLVERPLPVSHPTRRHTKRPPPFELLTIDGPWDEGQFEYHFQCHFCGDEFVLALDHEAGAAEWRTR